MKNSRLRYIYIANDLIMTFVGVVVFDIIRYYNLPYGYEIRQLDDWLFHDKRILGGLILFPIMMLIFYGVSGYYNDVRTKSRLDDFRNSMTVGFIGMLIIYFLTLINDYLPKRVHNYEQIAALWFCLSCPVMFGRMIITHFQRRRLRMLDGIYSAVIVGTPDRVRTLRKRLRPRQKNAVSQFRVIGELSPDMPYDKLGEEIIKFAPDTILVAQHPDGVPATTELISHLFPLGPSIHITPDLYQMLTSRTRLTDVVNEPMINITGAKISPATKNFKRISDIIGSAVALILLSPLYAVIAALIKIDSKGPVFYSQERIGYHKHPFEIIKFRTMLPDAEPDGPMLSSEEDPRITRVGKILRKYRLDELPQFWNVLKGDMSLVGPRPERKYYVDRIVERVPHYSLIHQVRPGITSWGMVKYGYASNIDEMVERLYYDLLYIENVSFGIDIKIIFHTLNTVVSGKGL